MERIEMLEEQRIWESFQKMEVAIGHNRWQVKRPFAVAEDTLIADPESPAARPSPARVGC